MQSEFENLLLDTQKEYSHSNRIKDKIIIVLIAFMFLEAVIGYCGFVWWKSKQMSDLWQVYGEWFTWTNIMRKQERN